jgi:dTDP-4-amino-4,6-dideoxygalactose transaminase
VKSNREIQPRIDVTKVFLPPIGEYEKYLEQIWKSSQVTNQGPLVGELEKKLLAYLGVANFQFVTNGTLALQIGLKALEIDDGEVITTPFSYVATTSSILWERCSPVFVDIEPQTFCIDANKIEAAITDKTKAIMAVHVFGYPCEVEKIESIAQKHNLKVIYDGAHAFGVTYKGKSLLSYGDVSMTSFHATKLFNTIEGGALITKNKALNDKIDLIKRFGHNGYKHYMLGLNAKASEFQAAMGLCNLKYLNENIEKRKKASELYDQLLGSTLEKPVVDTSTKYNYAYYPILFESEEQLLKKEEELNQENIFPRRYFYPSLTQLPYLPNKQKCSVSEDVASRVICLPLYADLEEKDIRRISEILAR